MAGKTDVGKQRVRNEDNFLIMEDFFLSSVADGMGGHVDGNIASQIAVDTLKENYLARYKEKIGDLSTKEDILKEQELFLGSVVQEANKNIFQRNRGCLTLQGMGTTVVVLQVGQGYVITACVGDSRIYRFRDDKLEQLTLDHSLVGELIRYNIIGEKDLLFLQNKNIITRALGMSDKVVVDITSHESKEDDIYLLCSDGLTDLVPDEIIRDIIGENRENLDNLVNILIDEANNRGGQDNITVSIVKIGKEE